MIKSDATYITYKCNLQNKRDNCNIISTIRKSKTLKHISISKKPFCNSKTKKGYIAYYSRKSNFRISELKIFVVTDTIVFSFYNL